MKGLAFIKDPDGYWIEIFDLKNIGKITSSAAWYGVGQSWGKICFSSLLFPNVDSKCHLWNW